MPLLALVTLADPSVLRIVLAKGNLSALFIAAAQPLLPLTIAAIGYVVMERVGEGDRRSTWPAGRWSREKKVAASATAAAVAVLLVFVSARAAILQVVIILLFISFRFVHRRAIRRILQIGAVTCFAVALLTWLDQKSDSLLAAFAGRALYALPREVILERGEASPGSYYIAGADDQIVMAMDGKPLVLRYIELDDIEVRLPCQHKTEELERSLASYTFRPDGGAAFCEPLAKCIGAAAGGALTSREIRNCVRESSSRK